MTEITKKDFQQLTSAMVEGFQNIYERFDGVDERFASMDERFSSMDRRFDGIDERLDGLEKRQGKFEEVLDHIAGRVDDLWTENAAQTISNRQFEVRISRIEEHLGLAAFPEEIEV
jgi:septation ring formation regulator EzrA